jgi:hypothetical protein
MRLNIEVTLNFTNTVHLARLDANERQSCFVCKAAFDSQLRKALGHLSSWYQLMAESNQTTIFRVLEAT